MKLRFAYLFGALSAIWSIFAQQSVQGQSRLQMGVAGNFGQDYFKIKSQDHIANISDSKFRSSTVAAGGGFWLEKSFAKRFSIVPEVNYHFVKVNDKVLVDHVAAIPGNMEEKYHSITLGLSTRYYVFVRKGFRVFLDAGIKPTK